MPTDKELMQQALNALVSSTGELHLRLASPTDMQLVKNHKAIKAIRARLSQCDRCGEVNPAEIHTCTPKQEPEPVAWITGGGKGELWWHQSEKFDTEGNLIGKNPDDVPLYTAPPQREWQGLTDKEIEDCLEMSIHGTCRAIEAALKAKNA